MISLASVSPAWLAGSILVPWLIFLLGKVASALMQCESAQHFRHHPEAQVRKYDFNGDIAAPVRSFCAPSSPATLQEQILILDSLMLPVYEKAVNFSCDGSSKLVAPQEEHHSTAHAKLNRHLCAELNLSELREKMDAAARKAVGSWWLISVVVLREAFFVFMPLSDYASLTKVRQPLRSIFLWHFFEENEHGCEMAYLYIKKYPYLCQRLVLLLPAVFVQGLAPLLSLPPLLSGRLGATPCSKMHIIFTMLSQSLKDFTLSVAIAVCIICGRIPSSSNIAEKRAKMLRIMQPHVELAPGFARAVTED